ncbi:MAG: SIS domain-containing protein [Promethearchaeota archaeon]|jgi:D-sedoheptulose 7-phosphate isomerase
MEFYTNYFDSISNQIKQVDTFLLEKAVGIIKGGQDRGGKSIIAGNGGSAAIASHVSVDLMKAAKVRAINFNEADLITCFANDYGYENWVEKAIEFYADKKDVAIMISSSGSSKNIVNGALKSKELGLKIITFSGFKTDNLLRQIGDINFWANSSNYNVVEITHQVWLLAIVEKIIDGSY